MESKMKSKSISALLATVALTISTGAALAEDVKIGVPSWTGAQAIAHLLGAVVESKIG